MTVYIVCVDHVDTRPTGQSYDEDGFYDDFYDEEVHFTEIVSVCATEALAQEEVDSYEYSDELGAMDTAFYTPYEVLEETKAKAEVRK